MSRIGRAVLGLLAAAVCVVAPAGVATAADTEGAACEVTYQHYPYSGGYTAILTVENTGDFTINGWTFYFPVDEDVEVIEFWEAQLVTPTGLVTARNAPHNPVLPPGRSITVGFRAKGTQAGGPSTFSVNNVVCSIATQPVVSGA